MATHLINETLREEFLFFKIQTIAEVFLFLFIILYYQLKTMSWVQYMSLIYNGAGARENSLDILI
jgi:hypothetical protein